MALFWQFCGFSSTKIFQSLQKYSVKKFYFFINHECLPHVKIRDPPSKSQPTTDRKWADKTIDYLDEIVSSSGPFYALLGYSQGSAVIPVYLANTENKFDRVMLYNGYVPTTHEGLVETINDKTPLTTPAMVMGYLFP